MQFEHTDSGFEARDTRTLPAQEKQENGTVKRVNLLIASFIFSMEMTMNSTNIRTFHAPICSLELSSRLLMF